MNSALLALAMLAQPESLTGKIQMQRIAKAIVPVARRYSLDPTLLAAIAIAESGGRNLVARRRGRGKRGADVGVFQIHCPKARPTCIRKFRNISNSAAEAAQILHQGRRLCKSPRPAYQKICKRGFWARYNPGSVRWTKRVRSLWARIRARIRPHVPPGV